MHVLHLPLLKRTFREHPLHKGNRAQFGQKRAVKADLIHPRLDLRGRFRRLAPFNRVDIHNHNVVGQILAKQRPKRRIAGIASIPISIRDTALRIRNFNRLKHCRQTGRSQDRINRHVTARKHLCLPSAHICGTDKQIRTGHATNPVIVKGLNQRL